MSQSGENDNIPASATNIEQLTRELDTLLDRYQSTSDKKAIALISAIRSLLNLNRKKQTP